MLAYHCRPTDRHLPMNKEFTAIRPDPASWANVVQFQGDAALGNTFRRYAKAPPSVLMGKIANRDRVFDIVEAIANSTMEISGTTAHWAKPHIDRQFFDLKDKF